LLSAAPYSEVVPVSEPSQLPLPSFALFFCSCFFAAPEFCEPLINIEKTTMPIIMEGNPILISLLTVFKAPCFDDLQRLSPNFLEVTYKIHRKNSIYQPK
jgi:hypothetical protein